MPDATETDLVLYDRQGAIVTISLNRPAKLNAFNDDLVIALADALRRFDADPEAQVAILAGSGRAFSSGADVYQRQLRSREELERLGGPSGVGADPFDLLTRSVNWKPVIAAVHGYVMGMALNLAMESDLIVAAAGTQFQVTETPRGLGGAKYWGLLDMRGAGAFGVEVALTGRFFTAEEAFEAKLINRVAPEGQHLDVARELAEAIAKNPPLSVRSIVRARRWYMERFGRELVAMTAPLKLHLTEDFREAASAFAEKRPPRPFKGR
jgi:enoyl-CoA hydratase/carnithine racemase